MGVPYMGVGWPTMNIAMENGAFEDVFPINHGDIPAIDQATIQLSLDSCSLISLAGVAGISSIEISSSKDLNNQRCCKRCPSHNAFSF